MRIDKAKPLILIGAGGHAKTLLDALESHQVIPAAYVDAKPQAWLEARGVKPLSESELITLLPQAPQLAIGFVGLDTTSLERRLRLMLEYESNGAVFPAIAHRSAIVSAQAELAPGVQLLAGSVVNGFAKIGKGSIINTSAVIEHDAVIGEGVHIAPRSVVLGGAKVGDVATIGSSAVVIQNTIVPSKHFVKALTVYT